VRARTRRRQATIQGALGGLPLDLVNQNMAGSPDLHKYQGWARDILNTGVLAIVICAPLGLLIIGARALGQSGCLSPRPGSSARRRLSACERARRRCAAAACLPQERRLPHKHASIDFNTVLLYRPLCRASRVTGLHSGSRPGRAAGAGEGPPGGRHILVVFL